MIKGVIFDLDGTVYRGREEVPGAAQFVRFLTEHDIRCLFVTNRANRTPAVVAKHLQEYGILCREEDVLTTAQATVQQLRHGSVYLIGEEGIRVELEKAGMPLTEEKPDYVIVSLDRAFTYDKMQTATRLIRAGARFIATNPDKCLNTDEGLCPGAGAIMASIEAASGVQPLVIGKPGPFIMELALARLGLPKHDVINIGDNLETDIPAGLNAGVRTAFILTGVSSREDLEKSPHHPTWIIENYDELTALIRHENGI